MNSQNKKSLQIVLLVLVAVLTLGIGYASITAVNLIISGNATASVNDNNFKVYFVPTVDTPSLTGNVTVSGNARINTEDNTKAEFDVSGLTKVGDYAIATYTILNNSNSIGADISLYLKNSNPEYFRVTETVTDTILQAGDTTTGSIKVELIKTPLNDDVSTSVTGTLKANAIENESATGLVPKSKASDDPESFATDSWATIKKAVQDNNTSAYNVGDTKEVLIDVDGDGTEELNLIRLSNKSTYDWCDNEDYSQTACGFVVEFVEMITIMPMRDTKTNIGGYPSTRVYDYLNNTLYENLPSDLKNAIKPTRVISGFACKSEVVWAADYSSYTCDDPDNNGKNFVSDNQKLYLLSGIEVYGSYADKRFDTASETTTQLDYYKPIVTSDYNQYDVIKQLIISHPHYQYGRPSWWLRSIPATNNCRYYTITGGNGVMSNEYSDENMGVSPAFRIG